METESIHSIDIESKETDAELQHISIFQGVMNWVNFTAGAGFVGISNTFCTLGFLPSLATHLIILALITWSNFVVLRFTEKTKKSSLAEIAEEILGAFGYWFVSIIVWFYLAGSMIAYILFTMEFMKPLIRYLGKAHFLESGSKFPYYFAAGVIFALYPTFLLRKLKPLSKVSALATFCIACFALFAAIVFLCDHPTQVHFESIKPAREWNLRSFATLIGLPLFIYNSIAAVPDFSKAARNKAVAMKTLCYGNLTLLLLYLSASVPSYVFVGNRLCKEENCDVFFIHFFQDGYKGLLISIASIFELVNVALTLTCYHFLLRRRTYLMVQRLRTPLGGEVVTPTMPSTFFVAHTLVIPVLFVIMFFIRGTLRFISFTGMVAGSCLIFILPPLLEMKNRGGIAYNISWTLSNGKSDDVNFAHLIWFNLILYFGMALFVYAFWEYLS